MKRGPKRASLAQGVTFVVSQPQHAAKHLAFVLVQEGARREIRRRRAFDAQRRRGQHHATDLGMIHPAQHAAFMHALVLKHFLERADRRGGHALLAGQRFEFRARVG